MGSSREYIDKNKDEIAKYMKEYSCKNKDKLKKYQKEYSKTHKESNVKRATEWNANNLEQRKQSILKCRLKKKYNITLEEYNKLLAKYDFCCHICKKKFGSTKKTGPHVDHNHKTNKVRSFMPSM